jgi:glycosyltransferase EpsF
VEKYFLDRLPYILKHDQIDLAFTEPDLIEYREQIDKRVGIKQIAHITNPIKYWMTWRRLLKKEQYDKVYCNTDYANIVLYMAVKSVGTKLTVHCHSTQIDMAAPIKKAIFTAYHYFGRIFTNLFADEKYACSEPAYRWLFGNSGVPNIKRNSIHSELYQYNPAVRKKMREQLGISQDTLVIGHVGRFSYAKNHEFLLEVFAEICARHIDAKLLLVNGTDQKDASWEAVQCKAELLQIEKDVCFLGYRSDIPELMQAMDVFLLPSRFEGMPLVGIEAQAAGLPCFISDQVTREVKVTELVEFLPITDSGVWAEAILKRWRDVRKDMSEYIKSSGYDFFTEMNAVS